MSAAPLRLLLLEDNAGDARLVQAALAHHAPGEYAITRVERLADALARVDAQHFEVALCDLGLPDSTGLATAQALVARAPALPLVVLTGSLDEDLGREAIREGAQDYLVKDEAPGLLLARTLRYAVERHRLQAGLLAANEALERRVAERTTELEAAVKKLQESEDRNRDLVENSQDLICTHDLEGRLLSVNAAAVRLSGYSREALLRMKMADLLTRGTRDGFAAYLNQIRISGAARGLMRIRTASGETRWWEYDNTLRTQGVAAPVVRGSAQDVTERKQAEEALRRSEARFRTLTEMSSDFYWESDAEHRLTQRGSAGHNASQVPEFRQGLHIGKRRWEVPYLSPEEAGWQAHRALLEAHQPFRDFELSRLGTDGSERHISISGDPVFAASGAFVGYRGVGSDITERKRAEAALRAAEEQFRGMVEQSIAGSYIIQDNKFAYVNPRFAEIFGYASAGELIGRESLSLVTEKDRDIVLEMRRRIEGGVTSLSYGFTVLRKDGSTTEVGVHSSRAIHKGRPAISGLVQDISEKKRAEEQIQRYIVQLEGAFMRTVEVATTLSEMRDPYTAGHERRVAEIAVAIGGELGFDARRQEGLRVAGYLHDIGKITIPSEILSKPGKLSRNEFELIKGHAQASYDVLKGVEFPWPVAEVALQHHERIDGSGYPQGLKGDAILLEARILSVADVIEAMSSHRPYRPGLGIEKALAEIERGRGSAYDAAVADACLTLFRENGYAIPA